MKGECEAGFGEQGELLVGARKRKAENSFKFATKLGRKLVEKGEDGKRKRSSVKCSKIDETLKKTYSLKSFRRARVWQGQ